MCRKGTARRQASVAILGMGEDGHTASLFPGARDLARALSSKSDYVAFDASGHAPFLEVQASRRGGLDGTGGADVIGRHRIPEDRERRRPAGGRASAVRSAGARPPPTSGASAIR